MGDHESYSKANRKRPKMRVVDVRVRRAENGGYIVTCNKEPVTDSYGGGSMMGGYESKDYTFGTSTAMATFVKSELHG